MKALQKQIATYMQNYSRCITDSKGVLTMMEKFEELNLQAYVDADDARMVFSGNKKVKDEAEKLCDSLENPYYQLYHWCEGELLDIQALGK